MQAARKKTWSSNTTAEETFAALLGVVQNGKFEITALSNEHHKLMFTSGRTALSWGQEYVAEVVPAGNRATLNLECGGLDGRPKALLDGWKNGKAADKVLEAVQDVLTGTAIAPVQTRASFATVKDGTTTPWDGQDLPEA